MEQFLANYGMVILLVVLFLLMVIPSILKSRSELKAREALNASIKKGSKIITSAGIYGTVESMVETSDGTVVTISTGDSKNPSTITMHINAIAGMDNKTIEKGSKKSKETKEDKKEDAEVVEEKETTEE